MSGVRATVAISESRLAEASAWVARRDAGLSAAEETEFQAWLRSSPECVDALQQCIGAWARLDVPRQRGAAEGMVLALASRHRRRRQRRTVFGAGLAAVLAVAALLVLRPTSTDILDADAVATVVQRRPAKSQELPDGSVVELNAGAEIAVDYTPERRTVRLLKGEAHFEVVKNPAQPFVVEAAGVNVRAVGTAFAVRFERAEVEVLVTEGVVAVDKPLGADTTADLFEKSGASQVPAGGRVLVRLNAPAETAPLVATLSAPELEEKLSWRTPRLDFSGTRLAEAVAQLNRHNDLKLVIEEASLAEMRVSGNVRIDNPEGFVRMAEPLGLEAERRGDEIRLRRAK